MEDTKPIPAFRKVLKRYRRQPVEGLDNSDLIDFLVGDERVVDIVCDESSTADIYRGRLFGLKGFPGFLYAPSALSDEVQRAFGLAAVSEYCEKPHATNIDAVPPKASEVIADDDDTMWNLWKHEHGFVARSSGNSSSHTNDRKKNTHSPRYYRSFGKLSWATCGFHYDWTARAYPATAQSPVPFALAKLARIFARTALQIEGSCEPSDQSTSDRCKFEATACIVNYYDSKAIMGGHRDDSEEAVTKPVISFSMGRPAIFLLGGATLEDEPVVPILVRPGDVMILGGASRLNYHAVAGLLPQPLPQPETSKLQINHNSAPFQVGYNCLFGGGGSVPIATTGDLEALSAFLSQHRININIRQVYNAA